MNNAMKFCDRRAGMKRFTGSVHPPEKALIMRYFVLALVALFFLITSWQVAYGADIPKEKIAFAYAAISPSMSGIWMAKEVGAFERNGLNVDLVFISSGSTAIQALVGGSVHAALGASNAVLAAILKGAPILAVASNTSRPGMALWVQPEIQGAEQLQGKTLAITRFGSTIDFVTRRWQSGHQKIWRVVEADLGFRSRQAEGRVASQAPGPRAKLLVDAAELGILFSMNLLGVYHRNLAGSRSGSSLIEVTLKRECVCEGFQTCMSRCVRRAHGAR